MKVITFNGVYKPGYKAGGPIKSISNMAAILNENIQFLVVASDRDYSDNEPYQDIKVNDWNKVDFEQVYYHQNNHINIYKFYKVLKDTNFDSVYLNGYYSNYTRKYLILDALKILPKKPIILCPRGDFTEGNSNSWLKFIKKMIYIKVLKLMRFNNNIVWHATSNEELNDIKKYIGDNNEINIIPNVAIESSNIALISQAKKTEGSIDLIFISRISKKKNLLGAIKLLKNLKGNIRLNIYGPIFDEEYWALCKQEIKKMPSNIHIEYRGSIDSKEVHNTFNKHHFFLFPTFGENYGHVVIESLLAGCPVILSDQTPWRKLERDGIGWDININNTEEFKKTLQECISMNQEEYNIICSKASEYGIKHVTENNLSKKYLTMFQKSALKGCRK